MMELKLYKKDRVYDRSLNYFKQGPLKTEPSIVTLHGVTGFVITTSPWKSHKQDTGRKETTYKDKYGPDREAINRHKVEGWEVDLFYDSSLSGSTRLYRPNVFGSKKADTFIPYVLTPCPVKSPILKDVEARYVTITGMNGTILAEGYEIND